jgi:hypothetical protein
MANTDPFDFNKFLKDVDKNIDPSTRDDALQEGVRDAMSDVMGEVAPRLWCIIQEQMMKDPHNNIHLNAVINASVFALLSWLVVVTPKGEESDQQLRDKVLQNLEQALSHGRDQGSQISHLAHNVGKMKLMEDSMNGVANVLVANSMVIKGIHKLIEEKGV